ncbi:MAG TPA: TetR/AcrR family transcriptional regulator [Pseudonocardia sp.]
MSAEQAPDAERPRGRASQRPTGVVLDGLIAAGVAQARSGGPDAVVLREATRAVGVSPNAAYRYFTDRDALLAAVAWEAMSMLALRMERGVAAVPNRHGTVRGARARLHAIGDAYLSFARDEPGLFRTAFAGSARTHTARAQVGPTGAPARTPMDILDAALDELVLAGALPPTRRAHATALAWATVHGVAVLRLSGTIGDRDTPAALDRAVTMFIQRGL